MTPFQGELNEGGVCQMMFWDHGDNWGWGNWLGMSLLMLIFWASIIGLIVLLARRPAKLDTTTRPYVEDLLAERFARGEIDEAEYQHRLSVLRQRPAADKPPARRVHMDKAASGR